ncbi:MAG: hypothetical protein E2O38_10440 [Proteobacteria bacterium]|nr:MAG: hypothetical protein E2O38_10440 [Pseudomonadota bacterium]
MTDQAKEPSAEKLFNDLFYEAFDLVYAQRIDLKRQLAELKTKSTQTTGSTEKLEIDYDTKDLEEDLEYLAEREQKLNETYERFERRQSDADRGATVKNGARKGGAATAELFKEKHSIWQAEAKKHWVKNPLQSRTHVAKKIAEGTDDSPETIRRHIHRPT